MKFEIGQQVLRASWDSEVTYVLCPECAGQKQLRVILPDETIIGVDCAGCSRGYEGPQGHLQVYDRRAKVLCETITGVEIRDGKTEWQTEGAYRASEDNLFLDGESAEARATELAEEADREERERIQRKEKNTRSWSWHVHYHRSEIRRAKQSIEYHEKKLAVARVKSREDKDAVTSSIGTEK